MTTHNDYDEHDEAANAASVRRVGRKDRKSRLPQTGALFDVASMPVSDSADDIQAVTPDEERYPPVSLPPLEVPLSRAERAARKQKAQRAEKSKAARPAPMATQRRAQDRRERAAQQNQIALFFFVATLAVVAYFIYIWQQPYSPLNPFPPPVQVIVVTATPEGVMRFRATTTTQTDENQCDQVIIAGTIAAPPDERFAVRVSTLDTIDDDSGFIDEGMITGQIPAYGENAYLFTLPLGAASYRVELYDTRETPLAAPVIVQAPATCLLNHIQVDFAS